MKSSKYTSIQDKAVYKIKQYTR